MFEQAKTAIADGVRQTASQAGEQVAQVSQGLTHLKDNLSQVIEDGREATKRAIEDGKMVTKRAIKRGRHAAEDFVDDTTHRIKREPLRSVGITFGVGLGLGVMIGWLATRQSCKD